jgi:enterochelin esterase-like enzyme
LEDFGGTLSFAPQRNHSRTVCSALAVRQGFVFFSGSRTRLVMKPLFTTLLLALTITTASAQAPLVSPEVHPDGRVTFRLEAKDATQVFVRGEAVSGERAMAKDERGVWTYTTPAPLEPDIYVYTYSVDGARLTDPSNPLLKYNLLSSESQVHVPGPATLPWELNEVRRGQIHRHYYRSAVAGDDRDFLVYTPPGYDPRANTQYPVLYLLHGYSDDATGWICAGFANVILDNLIARGEAKPMIVVMPLGYGTMEVIRIGWGGIRNRDGSRPDVWTENVTKFRDTLLDEVLPQVERHYRVHTDADHRAIAGLSMGGTESLFVGLNALERFSYVAAFSSGGLNENFDAVYPEIATKARGRLRLLWIGCGVDDGLIGINRRLHSWLDEQGVKHTYVETPGGHTFRVWRRYLAQVAPLLWR